MIRLTIIFLFVSLAANSQIPKFSPVNGKFDYRDSTAFSKYKNNLAGDSVLSTDSYGRLKMKKVTGTGAAVDTIYRITGTDSIYYIIGGITHKLKDSTGGSGGSTDTTSLSNRINLKLNISDTSTMLSPYINSVGFGLIKTGQQAKVDSNAIKALSGWGGRTSVLATVTDISTFSKTINNTDNIIISDTVRGGKFLLYSGSDAADNGMVFTDLDGNKWKRVVTDNKINSQWYGVASSNPGLGAGVDMRSKLITIRDYIYTHPQFNTLYIPKDTSTSSNNYYYLSDSILFDKPINILGDGTFSTPTTKIMTGNHKSGFVFQYLYGSTATSGKIENLYILGSNSIFGGTRDRNAHAIIVKSLIQINNVVIDQIEGNGIHISACLNPTTGENNNYGNASSSSVHNVWISYCCNGLFVEGCDANTIDFQNINSSENERWGIYDNGQLGNNYIKSHLAFNGVTSVGGNSVVSYGGNYYVSRYGYDGYWNDATDSNYNKQPDTNPTYWKQVTYSGSSAWSSSTRYYSGGTIAIRNVNAWASIQATYSEAFQPPAQLNSRTKVDNDGDNAAGVLGGGWHKMLNGIEYIHNSPVALISQTLNQTQPYLTIGGSDLDYSAPLVSKNDANLTGLADAAVFETLNSTNTSILLKHDSGVGKISYNGANFNFYAPSTTLVAQLNGTGINPIDHNTRDLGTTGIRWRNIYGVNLYGSGTNITGLLSDLYKRSDSVFYVKSGVETFAFIDSTGGGGGSMVYPGAGIALSTGAAWGTSITDNSANWNTAYGWGNHATAGYYVNSAGVTLNGNTTSGGNLTLMSTTNGTKGKILFGTSAYDEVNNRLGIQQATPTSKLQINTDANSVTQSDANGILLANATAATVGLQSISPPIVMQGNGWKTTATAGSQDVRFKMDVLPVQGSTNPTATWQLSKSINGAAYTTPLLVASTGDVTVSNTVGSFIFSAGTQVQAIGGSTGGASSIVYRTTDAGANVTPRFTSGASSVTAGVITTNIDPTNGFTIAAANGTRQIARAGINITNLGNTAGSESADLIFLTQSAGGAMTEKVRILSTGETGIGVTPTSALHTTSFATAYTTSAVDIAATSAMNIINITVSAKTVTLPTAVGIQGRQYTIINSSTGNITLATTSSQNIGNNTVATTATIATDKSMTVVSDNAAWKIITNN